MLEHLLAVELEAFAKLNVGVSDEFSEQVDSAVDSLTGVASSSVKRAGRNLWLEQHRENEAGFQTKQTGRQPSRRVRRKYSASRLVLEVFGEGQSFVSLC
jgi:hypothetical protein